MQRQPVLLPKILTRLTKRIKRHLKDCKKLWVATLMGDEWDFETAATVFATSVVVYCPELKPNFAVGNVA